LPMAVRVWLSDFLPRKKFFPVKPNILNLLLTRPCMYVILILTRKLYKGE
jgi:hypothetical protein